MKTREIMVLLLALIVLLPLAATAGAAGFANPQYLMETDQLAAKMADKSLVIVDVRKPEDYAEGHVKGAINIFIKDTQGTVSGVKEMMLPVPKVEELLGKKGISPDSFVVIYDEDIGEPAPRMFWTLDVLGHKNIAVLNGGMKKWAREKRPIATDPTVLPATKYTAKPDPAKAATLEEMKKGMGQKEQVYLDCRSDKEYTGEQLSREVARGGHIPGAVSMDWVNNVATRDGVKVLKDADALKAQYEKIGVTPDKQVMAYCRTGSRSSNTYFVLKLLGYPNVRNYDGSMIEWGNAPDLPLEKK